MFGIIKSRYSRASAHKTYILVDLNGCGRQAILQYFCECKVGARTTGTCSHVMTIIYYLCHAQFNGGVRPTANHLIELFDIANDFEETDSEGSFAEANHYDSDVESN